MATTPVFCDGLDHYRSLSPALIAEKYISRTTFDQQLRVAGRYDDAYLSDFAGGSMNNAFGEAWADVAISASYGYASMDLKLAHGSGGTFLADGDFLVLSGLVLSVPTKQTRVAVRTDGRIEVWRGTGNQFTGTLVAASAAAMLVQSEFRRVEVCWGQITGIWVRVNGVTVISEPSASVLAGAPGITRVGQYWSQFGFNAVLWDNYFVWSDSTAEQWLGNIQVATFWPASDVSLGGFAPNSGTNLFSRLYERNNYPTLSNEYPDGSTSYAATNATDACLLQMQTFRSYGTILAVAVNIEARCVSGCTHQGYANKNAVGNFYPTAQSLSGSDYKIHQFLFPKDPDTLATWDAADLISGIWTFGAAVTSPASEYRLSQVVIEVAYLRESSVGARYRVY